MIGCRYLELSEIPSPATKRLGTELEPHAQDRCGGQPNEGSSPPFLVKILTGQRHPYLRGSGSSVPFQAYSGWGRKGIPVGRISISLSNSRRANSSFPDSYPKGGAHILSL